MAKPDDTNEIPVEFTAPWVKRFFKRKFEVEIRTSNCDTDKMRIWIPAESVAGGKLDYDFDFPDELGKRCVKASNPHSERLIGSAWAGDVRVHDIAMPAALWRGVLQSFIDDPFDPDPRRIRLTKYQMGIIARALRMFDNEGTLEPDEIVTIGDCDASKKLLEDFELRIDTLTEEAFQIELLMLAMVSKQETGTVSSDDQETSRAEACQ